MECDRAVLEPSYLAAQYQVRATEGIYVLRIGQPATGFDRVVGDHGWAFITAWNPGSERLEEEANRKRQRALEDELARRGITMVRGAGISEDGSWSEESVLAIGLFTEDARALAIQWGQCAIVVGAGAGAPHLLWTDAASGAC